MNKVIILIIVFIFGVATPYAYRGMTYQPIYDIDICLKNEPVDSVKSSGYDE